MTNPDEGVPPERRAEARHHDRAAETVAVSSATALGLTVLMFAVTIDDNGAQAWLATIERL